MSFSNLNLKQLDITCSAKKYSQLIYSARRIQLKRNATLDDANTGTYGHPVLIPVPLGIKAGKAILLTLLYLGIKDIRLGPSLPAFVSPNVLNVLVDKFNIMPIKTPQEDLQAILG